MGRKEFTGGVDVKQNGVIKQLTKEDRSYYDVYDVMELLGVSKDEECGGISEHIAGMEWVVRMNNIQACAREIVEKEIAYF